MVRNYIYTQVANYIEGKVSGVYCTSEYELIPKSMPCVFILQSNKSTASPLLNGVSNAYNLEYEVQVFTSTNFQDAYTLMGHAEDKLLEMGFIEDSCMPIENIEREYHRLVARFHKVENTSQ